MTQMSEDDIYRTSTQYRLWSFTRESLASLRSTTNASAAEGVRAAIQSQRGQAASTTHDEKNSTRPDAKEVDCLTVEEEQKLVGFYCIKAMQFADFCEFPTNVKATAVQYLKRFYLSNSPMTYHPKEMMAAALFLSTKTENHYTSLRSFASKLPKTTPENVVAPEFLLTQGLRFTFDVRHPHRGLEGGVMELLGLAQGKGLADLQSKEGKTKSVDEVIRRIQVAHGKAKEIGKSSALLTDVYFLYTPSQIWLSSLFLADEPLTRFYIDTKIPPSLKPKLIITLQSCAQLLRSSVSANPGEAEMKALTKIDKKLFKCRNPEKVDLVSINKAQKRDSEGTEDGLSEKVIKKRKLEREKSEKDADDIFGPTLAKD
ncbi:cyclin-like protein [Usnea florida]